LIYRYRKGYRPASAYLDRVEVAGSNPVGIIPTNPSYSRVFYFAFINF
jgi:hypothetical protein